MAGKSCAWIAACAAAVLLTSAHARAADWQAGGGEAWQKVMTAAKKEGTVVVTGPPQLTKELVEGFERDTGIKLDYVAGEARVTASRVVRELRANNVTIDVSLTGTAELPIAKEGFFEDEKSRLLLPGVTDTKNWAGGELTDAGWLIWIAQHAHAGDAVREAAKRFEGLMDIQTVGLVHQPVTGADGAENRAALLEAIEAGAEPRRERLIHGRPRQAAGVGRVGRRAPGRCRVRD